MRPLEQPPELTGLSLVASRADFTFHLSENLLYFQGHFPKTPILPGVVQIHWAILWAQRLLDAGEKFSGMSQVKFHRPAKPGDQLSVSLDWNREKSLLSYRYSHVESAVSSGRIWLA